MNAQTTHPDLLLARRAAAGHAAAWEEIVERYGRRIFNVAYQFARRRDEAEDLTQDIFLRMFRRLHTYRGNVPLAAWALRLSRNLCIDNYRRARLERRLIALPEGVLEQIPGRDDLQARAEHKEKLHSVSRALDKIPEGLATVLVLRDLQGWSISETSAALGLPEGTIKSRLFRARRELHQKLAPGTDIDGEDEGRAEDTSC